MSDQSIIELQTKVAGLDNTVMSLQVELAEVLAACQGLQQQVTALESDIEEHRMSAFAETAALQVQIDELQSRP